MAATNNGGMPLSLKIMLGILIVIIVLIVAILIPLLIKDVQQDEYAVEYHDILKEVTSKEVREEGRYIRAPAVKMIRYKRTAQTLDFTHEKRVTCLSKEGLIMEIDFSLQYQIIKSNVHDVFKEYGLEEDWQKFLRSVISDTIMDTCSNYTGSQFYTMRSVIEASIEEHMDRAFLESKAYCTLSRIQVRNVAHPLAYAASNQRKQEVESEKVRVESARTQLLTDKRTELLVAEANAGIALTKANGQATAILSQATILADAEVRKWSERALAFKLVKEQLGNISNTDFINQYIRYIALVGASSPVISIPSV